MVLPRLEDSLYVLYKFHTSPSVPEEFKKQSSTIATLYFPICICLATAGATNHCVDNVSLPEQICMIINASNTPHILVRVVGLKQLVVSKKCPQDQCLVAIVEQGQGDEQELNASLTIYSCT